MTYTTPAAVAVELGVPAPVEDSPQWAQWQSWIERVEDDVSVRFRSLGLSLSDYLLDLTAKRRLTSIVAAAVARKVHNPDGLTSTTVSVDDGSITRRRDGYRGEDPLMLTDSEWRRLLPRVESDVFSMRARYVPGWSA